LKVVLLTDTFLPHAGGSRLYYYNLFKRIAEMGDRVSILTSKVPGWQVFDSKMKTQTLTIKRCFKPLKDLSYAQLPRLVGPFVIAAAAAISQSPDILHCGDLYPPGLIGVILKKWGHLPFVAYCHGEDITLTDQRRFQPKVRNLIYRRADAVIANSDFAVTNLLRIGISQEKIHKITPGVDTSVFYPLAPDADLRQRYGIRNEVVLVTVARLVPRKGQSRVLHALAVLGSTIPSVKYVICGSGRDEPRLRAITSELKLQDRVVFAGSVPEDQLNLHYNLADIVVMPNHEEVGDVEGFGMAFLEGSAVGKPVIGGRSGGAPEAVLDGETGILVGTDDDEELRRALHTLIINAELRRKFGANGLSRAQSAFSWEKRAVRLREINCNIVASRRKAIPV
jgi:phosphatidylinositol alpha-1,6-mannosyltransferase